MKSINDYLNNINESNIISNKSLLSNEQLQTIEDELNASDLIGMTMKVKYEISKSISNQTVKYDVSGMRKEIEHVFGHALEQLFKDTITNSLVHLDIADKKLDEGVLIDGEIYHVEIKSSSRDVNKNGVTANHGRGIYLTKKEITDLTNGILIFIYYDLDETGTCTVKKVYVRTANLIEISNDENTITKLVPLK